MSRIAQWLLFLNYMKGKKTSEFCPQEPGSFGPQDHFEEWSGSVCSVCYPHSAEAAICTAYEDSSNESQGRSRQIKFSFKLMVS